MFTRFEQTIAVVITTVFISLFSNITSMSLVAEVKPARRPKRAAFNPPAEQTVCKEAPVFLKAGTKIRDA